MTARRAVAEQVVGAEALLEMPTGRPAAAVVAAAVAGELTRRAGRFACDAQ